mmetsp:Transcript_18552/g.53256  ORF Transcript_18552/g.53256 Transcript_18552/m.53256 type:complete len:139 (-) Transcript_18552:234-650(-)
MFNIIARNVALRDKGRPNLLVRLFSNHYGRIEARKAGNEDDLHSILMNSPPYPYTKLAAHEWRSHTGVGDLVFQAPGKNQYLVVEAKLLRNGVQKKREMVREQANRYGRDWKRKHPSAFVKYATFTDKDGLVPLGELP